MPAAAPARHRRAITARKAAPARIPPADRRPPSSRGATAAPARRRDAAPARRPDAPPARRHLRVVTDARVLAARRRRRMRAVVLLVGVFMVGALFALAAFHAVIASGQAEIDRIETEVADAQTRYERLRVDVAELEAPARIVQEAGQRLGMVPPPDVTYLTASDTVSAEIGQAAASDPPPTTSEVGDRAAWASIKPYLSGRP